MTINAITEIHTAVETLILGCWTIAILGCGLATLPLWMRRH